MIKTLKQLLDDISVPIRTLSANQAAAERRENGGLLIDVREPAEHLASPASGAVNIPRGVLEMKIIDMIQEASHPLYLHCASSARARLAAEQLLRIGYTNVTVITCAVPIIVDEFK